MRLKQKKESVMTEIEQLSYHIIRAGLETYNQMGFGFLEKTYRKAMAYEMRSLGLLVEEEKPVRIFYKNQDR